MKQLYLILFLIPLSASAQYIDGSSKDILQNISQEQYEAGGNDPEPETNCGGVERWSVKVFTDNKEYMINWTPKNATIAHLTTLPVPIWSYNMSRQALEDSTWTVTCHITIKKSENDSDAHLVLSDGTHTMIGEVPDPFCNSVSSSPKINQIKAAHSWIWQYIGPGNYFNLSLPLVTVTGVGFLDTAHGQTGAAPNQLELHSIIDIHFATTTEVEEYENAQVSVSPNPSGGHFHFSFGEPEDTYLQIFNVLGQQVFGSGTGRLSSMEVDLSEQPKGIYYARFISHKGKLTRKLIIQ